MRLSSTEYEYCTAGDEALRDILNEEKVVDNTIMFAHEAWKLSGNGEQISEHLSTERVQNE